MTESSSTQSGYAAVNGAQLYYEIAGDGQPLVLVHAGIADRRMWDGQIAPFAKRYRVIRYDMRGYGRSAMVEGEFSHRADLHGLLSFLGVERAYLLGCSMGGGAIIDFALEHPAMAGALITVGSAPGGYEFTGDPPRQWNDLVAAFKQGDLERTNELELELWVDGPQRTPDQVDPAVRALVREMNLIALKSEAAGLGKEQPLDPPAMTRLDELAAPVLLMIGDLDDANLVKATAELAQRIPGARSATIAGAAHLPSMERPEEFNRVVLDFLGGL